MGGTGFDGGCEDGSDAVGLQDLGVLGAVVVAQEEAAFGLGLSLIHISEPTRPY